MNTDNYFNGLKRNIGFNLVFGIIIIALILLAQHFNLL